MTAIQDAIRNIPFNFKIESFKMDGGKIVISHLILRYKKGNDYFYYLKNKTPIILIFDDKVSLDELTFLRRLMLSYKENKISIVIAGIPLCIFKKIFGQFDNLRMNYDSLKLSDFFFQRASEVVYNSRCKECILYGKCPGLKLIKDNVKDIGYLIYPHSIIEKVERNRHLIKDYENYECFFAHAKENIGRFSFRNFQMVFAFSKRKSDFVSRLVYYVHFLEEDFFYDEIVFLSQHVSNVSFLKKLRSELFSLRVNRFGYSYVKNEGVLRESFYLFFAKDSFLISFLRINFFNVNTKFKFESFDFIGIDYLNDALHEVKLYSRITNLNMLLFFLKKIEINLVEFLRFGLPYLFVRRISSEGDLRGFKIEFNFDDSKAKEFITFIDQRFGIKCEKFNYGRINIMALDFTLKGILNKVVFYSN